MVRTTKSSKAPPKSSAKPEKPAKTRNPPRKKKSVPTIEEPSTEEVVTKNTDEPNNNIIHFLNQLQKGRLSQTATKKMHQLAIIKDAKTFTVIRLDTVFERRVTSLTWHPTISNMIGLASKGGGLILAKVSKNEMDIVEQYPGIGPGGSILALKFHPTNNEVFYTASLDGTVCYRNYFNKKCVQYLSTGNFDHWYTSFDMSEETGVMLAGDTKGVVTLLSKNGCKVNEAKIHKTGKVNHIEFCPRKSWLFVTAGLDKSVKLWDLRQMSNEAKPLHTLFHERPINSAYFSRTDSNHLLTTDQHSEIRVYQAPFWDLTRIIPHPHRQFQHMTPIKATWHPLEDIVVCGRYPDPKFPGTPPGELSTVDLMCPMTGQMLSQLHYPPFKGIYSLCQFNNNGSLLGCGSGFKSLIWAPHPKKFTESWSKENRNKDESDDGDSEDESVNDIYKPSTSNRVLDSLPVNRRNTKSTNNNCKKKGKKSDELDRNPP